MNTSPGPFPALEVPCREGLCSLGYISCVAKMPLTLTHVLEMRATGRRERKNCRTKRERDKTGAKDKKGGRKKEGTQRDGWKETEPSETGQEGAEGELKLPLDEWGQGAGSIQPAGPPSTWEDGPSALSRPLGLHLYTVQPPPHKDPASSCPPVSFPGLSSSSQTHSGAWARAGDRRAE